MKLILLTASILVATIVSSAGASLSKSYSYFTIGGTTLDDIKSELDTRGPQVRSTGRRHPGATRMEFAKTLGYAQKGRSCWISEAQVSLTAKVILPRWRWRGRSDKDVRLVWDVLSRDIKRHEEGHIVIAKNYAREIEQTLVKLDRQSTCEIAAEKAEIKFDKILERHNRAQDHFDWVEGINFESRLSRLIYYRLEWIQNHQTVREKATWLERNCPSSPAHATPSFFCRLVEDVVY